MKRRTVSKQWRSVDLSETMEYLVRKGYTLHGADQCEVCFRYGGEKHACAYIELDDLPAYLCRKRWATVAMSVGSAECLLSARSGLSSAAHASGSRMRRIAGYVEPAIRDTQWNTSASSPAAASGMLGGPPFTVTWGWHRAGFTVGSRAPHPG